MVLNHPSPSQSSSQLAAFVFLIKSVTFFLRFSCSFMTAVDSPSTPFLLSLAFSFFFLVFSKILCILICFITETVTDSVLGSKKENKTEELGGPKNGLRMVHLNISSLYSSFCLKKQEEKKRGSNSHSQKRQ